MYRPAFSRELAIVLMATLGVAVATPVAGAAAIPRRVSPVTRQASPDVWQLARWIVAHGDNQGLSIIIVDKTSAKVFAIDSGGALVGAAPALLGLAYGDESPPGIGERRLASITPQERITPAGRFIATLGRNIGGKEVLWVDYKAAISLHPVITTNPAEHRLRRLATASPADNRISYGCINVPQTFFEEVVRPLFKGKGGIVYVLPEVRSVESVFFLGEAGEPAKAPPVGAP